MPNWQFSQYMDIGDDVLEDEDVVVSLVEVHLFIFLDGGLDFSDVLVI